MNSIDVAWPFVPMVKYEPQYARSIGRWMLNNVNNCRLFFPDQLPDSLQCLPGHQQYTNSIIAYEGLRYEDIIYQREEHKGKHPIALGDGPLWNPANPPESMFSVYSTSATGIFGAIVETMDVEGILRLNCNATDFYAARPFPVYLMYNPFPEARTVGYAVGAEKKTCSTSYPGPIWPGSEWECAHPSGSGRFGHRCRIARRQPHLPR